MRVTQPAAPFEKRQTPVVSRFSAKTVQQVLDKLLVSDQASLQTPQERWLSLVAARVRTARPKYTKTAVEYLGVEPAAEDLLSELSIGEISACYEALLATLDSAARKESGQFFTPDDAAAFMAGYSLDFPTGVWLDPCCGVGNLAWHLVAVQNDPSDFLKNRLVLSDQDGVALMSAVALLSAEFGDPQDEELLANVGRRAVRRDFLSVEAVVEHDFVICNPPYAAATKRPDLRTGDCRDLYAYFWERIGLSSRGYIVVTPASYMSAPKYAPLRELLNQVSRGGRVFVFDNVPDTLFRGFKYGSTNTSKTNFVRAAVTVSSPRYSDWQTTPILRWQATERAAMFEQCHLLLRSRRIGPHGEWAKLTPGVLDAWDVLANVSSTLNDVVSAKASEFFLDVALTPRYFISASFRSLKRGSKATLYFNDAQSRDKAAIVLNSSLAYLWWRSLDGGVTLPMRVLLSTPIPHFLTVDQALIRAIRESETDNLVVKKNAGSLNENVKHDAELVHTLNSAVIPGDPDLDLLYSNSMFPLDATYG